MYKINFKNVRKGYILGGCFFGIGIIVLILFLYIFFGDVIKRISYNSSIEASRIEDNSYTNDEGDLIYSPIYHFRVNGNDYICEASYSSGFSVSSNRRTVYYDSNNPNNCVTDYTASFKLTSFIALLLPLAFTIIGFIQLKKNIKKINTIKMLSINGTLIKNLPYNLEETNIIINNIPLYAIAIDYTMPNGEVMHLVGEPRYDRKNKDEDGLVDLLIDLNNPNNYYIDFNITKKDN